MALLSLESILNVIYLGSFVVFFAFGQWIQTSIILVGVRRNLGRLELFRNTARNRLRDTVIQLGAYASDVQNTLERLANYFIAPISLDRLVGIGNTMGID